MSDTEHGCFDECTMGPNVRVGGEKGKCALPPCVTGVPSVFATRGIPATVCPGASRRSPSVLPPWHRILNGVKGPAAVAELLGVPVPEPQE